MIALRRNVKSRGAPMQALDLQTICNKSRAHGNHTKCSKLCQAESLDRLAREKQ